ncbi:glycoside hydrolase family 88 protein [Enterococcus faecium]|uniref:glycoside hydrolase family 88 protein n=1 Tax=Enterococcus faecium TaxID=1352 RepID=UPI002DBF8E7F|nr:glycoside hydrolase family 88 protein [Enterococcus faecium]MEB5582450.1 glycoside hydrolase family 88 protein [Enterococcus faecium]
MDNRTNIVELDWLVSEIDFIEKQVRENQEKFKFLVPAADSNNHVYEAEENTDWTASFWLGILFLTKELSNSKDFDRTIESQLASFKERLEKDIALDTHDIGFLYQLSAVADYRLNKNESSKQIAIQAADRLMERYSPKSQIIQAWGDLDDPKQRGRMIIDCLMNLPLLYFATEATGDESYKTAAYNHAKQTQKYIVRDNATTYHTYYFDDVTGVPKYGRTQQGYSDESCWARGQAWGIYGFTLSYLYTGDGSFLETATQLADYFLQELPEDLICYWDLIFKEGSQEEKDSSAAAIAACGLLELSKQLPVSDHRHFDYEEMAVKILGELQKNYTTKQVDGSNGLLLHAVYDKNSLKGVDECVIWGDYFYVEGITRLAKKWYCYW